MSVTVGSGWLRCTHTSFMLHGPLHGGKAALQLGIVRIQLQTGLVGVVRTDEVALSMEGGTLAAPALGPVRLECCGLVGIVESVGPVLLGGVRCGAITVEDVVLGLEGNGLGELVARGVTRSASWGRNDGGRLREGYLHGIVKVLFGNGFVAQGLELVCGSHNERRGGRVEEVVLCRVHLEGQSVPEIGEQIDCALSESLRDVGRMW